jgi:hypothetical protein
MYKKKTAVRDRQGQKEVSAEGDSEVGPPRARETMESRSQEEEPSGRRVTAEASISVLIFL